MEAEVVPGNEVGEVWEFKSERESLKKMMMYLEREESLPGFGGNVKIRMVQLGVTCGKS